MTAVFVTSTGTDIGKTFVTRGLIGQLRSRGRSVDAIKPVLSGYDPHEAPGSDPGLLLAALGRAVTAENIARLSPWRFTAPLSPHTAARREGRTVAFADIVAFCRDAAAGSSEILLVEGAGGVMTPINDGHTMLDLITALAAPTVLVTGSYLGTISHTLTALDALARRKLQIAAAVISETEGSPVPLDETTAALAQFAPSTTVVALPRLRPGQFDHPALDHIVAALDRAVAQR
jgi:dethiobiotin synthetase